MHRPTTVCSTISKRTRQFPGSSTCQKIMLPTLQPMRTTNLIQHRLSRLQSQVVRVVEAEPAARGLELRGRQALEAALRGHGHEDWQRHGAVGEVQRGGARLGFLLASLRQIGRIIASRFCLRNILRAGRSGGLWAVALCREIGWPWRTKLGSY